MALVREHHASIGGQASGGEGLNQDSSKLVLTRTMKLRHGRNSAHSMLATQGGALRVGQPRTLRRPVARSHRTAWKKAEAAAKMDMSAASAAGGEGPGWVSSQGCLEREEKREGARQCPAAILWASAQGRNYTNRWMITTRGPCTQPCGSAVAHQIYW